MGNLSIRELKTFLHIQVGSIVLTAIMLARHALVGPAGTGALHLLPFDYVIIGLLIATFISHFFIVRSCERKLCERAVMGYIFLTVGLLLYLLLFH